MEVVFNEDKFKPNSYPQKQKNCLFYAVEGDRIEELLEANPHAEKIFKEYCIKQTEYLRDTRKLGLHLERNNRTNFDFTRKGKRKIIQLNDALDYDELDFEVLQDKEPEIEDQTHELSYEVNKQIDTLI